LPDNDNSLIGINENGELVLKSGAIKGNTHVSDEGANGGGVEMWGGNLHYGRRHDFWQHRHRR
jgi:hypothetical protein